MTATPQYVTTAGADQLSATARDHLWMHFTRHSTSRTAARCRSSSAARAPTSGTARGKAYLDGLAGLFVVQAGHGRRELAEAAFKQANELAFFPLWSYAHPQAIELADRLADAVAGRPEQGLLHHRWRRGCRDRVEARQAVLEARRQADEDQGHQPQHRLSRHTAGRAVDHRHPGREEVVRTARPGRAQGRRTRTSTARPNTATTTRRSAAGRPTRSTSPSRWRARTQLRPSSSSPSRTPVGASRRRPATSSGCARSATGTTC